MVRDYLTRTRWGGGKGSVSSLELPRFLLLGRVAAFFAIQGAGVGALARPRAFSAGSTRPARFGLARPHARG